MFRRLFRPALALAAVLSLLFPATALPANSFSTGPGVFVSASDDGSPARESEKALWRAVSFGVAEDGTFSAKGRANVTVKEPSGIHVTVASYDVILDGTYDPVAATFSGTFTIAEKWSRTKKDSKYKQDGSGTFSGTFTGRPTSGNEITLTFSGTRATEDTTIADNGRSEENDNSYQLQHVVKFPVSGVLPAAPAEAQSEAPDSGAAFSDFSGQVEVLIPTGYDANGKPLYDEEAWTFAKLDMKLPAGARIKTDTDSAVILSFADMTTFQMKPESEIILGDPSTPENPLKILAGDLLVQTKKLIEGKQLFEGSQAVAGIKGTTFVISDTGSKTTLKVIEGIVEFMPKSGGAPVLVEIGGTISADANGPSEVTPFDVAEEKDSWKKATTDAGRDAAPNGNEGGDRPSVVLIAGIVAAVIVLGLGAVLLRKRRAGA